MAGILRRFSTGRLQTQYAPLVKQYNEQGYAILRGVVPPGLVAEMGGHLDFLQRKYPDVPTEHLHHLIMRNDPFWVRVASEPRLLDLAQAFAPFLHDGNIALFSSHYFLKKPREGMAVLWHQDGSYWPLRPMDVLTLWVAVDRSNRHNGCLKVVKGSHRTALAELRPDRSVKNVLGSATHTDEEIDPSLVEYLELEPGDVSIHHPNIVHASDANTSAFRRAGLTVRYMSTRTQCTDPEQPVMLMRGTAVPGVNEYRSFPAYRPGYDMPFEGCDTWNARRYKSSNPAEEAYFARTDYGNMEQEIRAGLLAFVDKLGGR